MHLSNKNPDDKVLQFNSPGSIGKSQREWSSNLESPVSSEGINPLANDERDGNKFPDNLCGRDLAYITDESDQELKHLPENTSMCQSPQGEEVAEDPSNQEENHEFADSDSKYPFPTKRVILARDSPGKDFIKVVGGKEMPFSGGLLHAYVSKLYPWAPESLDIQEGDIVLEWNGKSLENKTFEEVNPIVIDWDGEIEVLLRGNYNILTGKERTSKDFTDDSSRESDSNITTPAEGKAEISKRDKFGKRTSSADSTSNIYTQMFKQMTDDDDEVTSVAGSQPQTTDTDSHGYLNRTSNHTTTPPRRKSAKQTCISPSKLSLHKNDKAQSTRTKNGLVQLQICHDSKANVLYVTVVKAKFPKQSNHEGTDQVITDPYIMVNLLPERIAENQRRTRHIPMSLSPFWNQTMVYPNASLREIKNKSLEVTAWNYKCSGEDTLLGKVIIPISDEIIDEQPHYYSLTNNEVNLVKSKKAKFDKFLLDDGKRFSGSASSRCSVVQAMERRPTLSLLSPSGIPTKTRLIPRDCHENFCTVL